LLFNGRHAHCWSPIAAWSAESRAEFDSAYELEVAGKFKEAAQRYQSVVKDISGRALWPQANFNSANCLSQAGEYKKAAEAFELLAKQYPNDLLAHEALWRSVTLHSGVLKDRPSAIRVAQTLHRVYPRTEYGERAAYTEAVLHYWNGELPKARVAINRYSLEYPGGKFREAVAALTGMIAAKK
jgi:TolA-binding protein